MKFWSLLIWVTQFGFSVVFPPCFFLVLANWLQNRYDLGIWVLILGGFIGVMTSIRSVKACIHTMRRDAERAGNEDTPPTAFNDHR